MEAAEFSRSKITIMALPRWVDKKSFQIISKYFLGGWRMSEQLRALTALPEVLTSVPTST